MMQIFVKFCAVISIGLMLAHSAYSQSALDASANSMPQAAVSTTSTPPTTSESPTSAQPSISSNMASGIGSMLDSIDMNKLTATPQKDLLTLAIGGLTGFAVGGFLSGLGILNIEVLGLAVIPLASGLAGIYFANEGYFDQPRKMVGDKF